MNLRLRFLLSLLAVIAIMAVPAVYGVSRVAHVRDIALDLREQAASSALAVGRLRTALEQFDRYQRLYIATTDPGHADLMWNRLGQASAELDSLYMRGYGDVVASADLPLAELSVVTGRIADLVSARLLGAATTYREIAAEPLWIRAVSSVPQLAAAIDLHTSSGAVQAERSADSSFTAATVATLIAVFLAGMLAVAAAGVLSGPLERLRTAMATVAEGTFKAPPDLPYNRLDEIGDLFRSFQSMTLRLAQLDRMKAEFIGVASHELKTPIGIIGGYAELIRDEAGADMSPRHHELLAALADQTEVLRRRLDQLLEISMMESGGLMLGLEEVYLRHFMEGIERDYSTLARQRGITFAVRIDERVPPFMFADPDVLRVNVFANLMSNALKFTPPGGSVDVAVRSDGDRVVFDITDTGPGIDPDHLRHVFEKYYQGPDSRGGSGLGLAIAKAAIESHGGRIDVQSRLGRGARFRVVLPDGIHHEESEVVAAEKSEGAPAAETPRVIA